MIDNESSQFQIIAKHTNVYSFKIINNPQNQRIATRKKYSSQKLIPNSSRMINPLQSLLIILLCACLSLAYTSQARKCESNANMKYELNHTHEVRGYHSMCSEFAKRTCCSGKNFDALSKKISSKLITPPNQQHPLSLGCRRKLTTLLCSTCEGDIGEKVVDGVCPNVCVSAYDSCKEDYFSIDSLNKIKVCRDDDIICSKLKDILPDQQNATLLCEMFGIQTAIHDCWNGVPSWQVKGLPKSKTNYHPTNTKQKRKTQKSLINSLLKLQTKYWVYIALVSVLLSILAYKWLSIKLQNQGRKIKNL